MDFWAILLPNMSYELILIQISDQIVAYLFSLHQKTCYGKSYLNVNNQLGNFPDDILRLIFSKLSFSLPRYLYSTSRDIH